MLPLESVTVMVAVTGNVAVIVSVTEMVDSCLVVVAVAEDGHWYSVVVTVTVAGVQKALSLVVLAMFLLTIP